MTSTRRISASLGIVTLAGMLGTSPAEAACGCTQMTIRTAATPQTLCSNRNLVDLTECAKVATHGAGPCAAFTYKYDCPVGTTNQSNTENHYGFVAEAQITGGSNLADCEKGQALQLTITSNMPVVKPAIAYAHPAGLVTIGGATFQIEPANGVRVYPDVGTNDHGHPLYGSDNYSNPASPHHLIQWSSPVLKWWDNTDQEKDDPAEQARWRYRFVSFVKGSAGQSSCACFFDVDVNWAANAPTPATAIAVQPGSTNCMIH